MRTLYALVPALLLTAFLSGCSEGMDDSATLEAGAGDAALAQAAAPELPAPVSLRVEGDLYGSHSQVWSWAVADVAPSRFEAQFGFSGANQPSPGYLLQETAVRLLDPDGNVQGEYRTAFAVGQFQQSAIEFRVPPHSAVAPGLWSLELVAGPGSLAHYALEVAVDYAPPALESQAEAGEA